MPTADLLLAACMFLGAMLYTSVGHAGASAYIALMALFGVAPAVMRPTALALNVLVASFRSFRFIRVARFRWRAVWPFLGAPSLRLHRRRYPAPGAYYRPIVGACSCRGGAAPMATRACDGLTGTGGGIFLSRLCCSWAGRRRNPPRAVRRGVGYMAGIDVGSCGLA